MSLTIPLADLTGGVAPRIRVEEQQGGAAVAEFGQRLARIGNAMETDRLDREAVTVRSRMQRDLGQLALEMEGIGDPDALDQTWMERSSALREEVLGAADPRNRARLEANWNELNDRHSLRIGARAIEARNSAWRASLDEQAYSYVSTAAGADTETREAGQNLLADTVADGIRSGRITAEQGGAILRSAAQDGERAALTGRLDTDPDGALTALEAGEYDGLDPLYREGAKSTARAAIATREAKLQAEANRQTKERERQLDERLDAVVANARAGRVNTWETDLMADPEVKARPGYAEAEAAIAVRKAMPEFALLPPAEQKALVDTEAAKAITDPWENRKLDAMRASAKANAEAWAGDAIKQASALGLTVPEMPDPAGDPGEFAAGLAARRGFALSLKDRGYVSEARFFSAEEQARLAKATAKTSAPEDRAALAQAFVSAFGKDAPRALAEIKGDDTFGHMGGLASAGGSPGLVEEAFRGQQLIDEKTVALPSAKERREWADDALGDVLVGDALVEGRILRAADAIYATRAARSGDPDRDVYMAAVQAAIGADQTARGDQTGGVQRVRRVATLLPIGVSGADVEAALGRDDAADRLRAASASGGQPLYAGQALDAEMVGGLRLRAIGDDVYTLYADRRGRRFDVTDSSTGRPYVVRLSRFLAEGGR